jgi:uncharacterized protein (DUF4415 family)
MNQQEAAQFLGVSSRMLRIYTQQGRIGAHRDKGKPRRTLVYEEGELQRLKGELEQSRRWSNPKPANESTEHVGFRLDTYYLRHLTQAAAERGLSPGQYARQLVIQALEERATGTAPAAEENARITQGLQKDIEQTKQDVERTAEEMVALRIDLANAVLALFTHAGKLEPEQAEEWVRVNLVKESI